MKKRILLVSVGVLPQFSGAAKGTFLPRLGLACIAAVTPPEWDVQIIADVRKENIPVEEGYDLVGFSVPTPFAPHSYELADRFRSLGSRVVIGGPSPSRSTVSTISLAQSTHPESSSPGTLIW